MSTNATSRVAEKLQAVYDGADPEERAVLDELGGVLRALGGSADGDGPDEVVGFGMTDLIKGRNAGAPNATGGTDKLGNFEIQDLMSTYNAGYELGTMLGTRWPPR